MKATLPKASASSLVLAALFSLTACSTPDPQPPPALGIPSLSADRLDFGTVYAGTAASAELVVSNSGDGPLTLERVERDAAAVMVTPGTVQLAPGEAATLQFELETGSEVELDGQVRLAFSGGVEKAVALSGRVVRAGCELPDSLDFGKVRLSTRAAATVALRNSNELPLTIELSLASGFEKQIYRFADGFDAATRTLPAGDTLQIPLVFAPTDAGAHTATLTVRSASGCGPRVMLLTGEGVERMVVSDATSVDLGYVHPGMKRSATFRLANHGADAVTLGLLQPLANGPFSLDPPIEGATIPGRGELAVTVTFAPTQVGSRSALLELTSSDGGPSLPIELTGWGGGPKVSAPQELEFGDVAVGSVQRRRIVLKNVGSDVAATLDDNLKLERDGRARMPELSGDSGGDFALEVPPSGYTAAGVAAGGQIELDVRIAPLSTGAKSARLVVYTNDPQTPRLEIPLTANAAAFPSCELEVSQSSLDFGLTRATAVRELPLFVRNIGTSPSDVCHVFRASLRETGAKEFSIPDSPVGPFALQPGESRRLMVRFAPAAVATYASELELATSDVQRSNVRIPLMGSAGQGCLVFDSSFGDLGTVPSGCSSRAAELDVYNVCASGFALEELRIESGQSNAFSIMSAPALPRTIASGGLLKIQVRFAPGSSGRHEAALVFGSASAGERRVLHLRGETAPLRVDRFTVGPREADVLWILDDSGSPRDKLNDIGSKFGTFVTKAAQHGVDMRLAVTTTSVCAPNHSGSYCVNGRFLTGRGAFWGDGAGPRFLTPQMPNFQTLVQSYFDVGSNGSATEALLEALRLAFSEPNLSSTNAGFRRPDARLVVLFGTHAKEQSPLAVATYVQFLRDLAPRPGQAFASGIIATLDPNSVPFCMYDDATAGQSPRLKDFIAAFGGTPEEFCHPNTEESLARLGDQAFGSYSRFALLQTPDTGSGAIEVRVDGTVMPQGGGAGTTNWWFDSGTRTLAFEPNVAPDPWQMVEVTYAPVCSP